MMLQIGNKKKAAFTLIEILLAVVVLSLGTLFIYRSFFTSLNALERTSRRLWLSFWSEEKMWEKIDRFRRLGATDQQNRGLAEINGKDFFWRLSIHPAFGSPDLYGFELSVAESKGKKSREKSFQYFFKNPEENN